MALQRHPVLLLPGDVAGLRHVLGGDAHGHIGAGLILLDPAAADLVLGAHGQQGHCLHTAGHHHLGVAAADHVDGGIDGLQSGGTETIHRLGGHIIGHASAQADQAADVVALDLLAFGAANDDIGDILGVQLGDLVEDLAEDLAAEIHGMGVAQRPLFRAAHGTAPKGGDDNVLRLKMAHESLTPFSHSHKHIIYLGIYFFLIRLAVPTITFPPA